ncbi:SAV_2336 N-terminal domain-related protein [Streptomyces yerevanensis]|uniref:SAV_2336 N-terminal domain-related protein n=1 Tax=Streptomyces yerevanensis TaxID=66378 RepID=UPI00068DE1A3|nr:SAV_2336 N-terminal domain-related protein [Streptomyces yerevanensis]
MSDPAAVDGSGGTGAARLADLLAEVSGGDLPTSVELAELLWLARHMKEPEPAAPSVDPPPVRPERAEPEREIPPLEAGGPSQQHIPDAAPPPEPERRPDGRVPLRLPGPSAPDEPRDPNGSYTSLLAPAPPMLTHPLALQRALRPLKRRVPAPVGKELDEEATAHRIARLGAAPRWWLPVLRPATERWLTLHLVYDAGPTMPVWRPLVRELHTALAQSGILRTVELHRLEADGTVRRPGSQESYADGRTVTLLVSDCMGPQWRDGPAGTRWYGTLRRWAARMPVAVIQPLPERLWRTTALPASTAQIVSPSPAAPNSAYDVDAYAADHPLPGTLPLPVLEPSAPWLANWSALLADAGKLPGSVALLGHTPPPAPVDDQGRSEIERLSPEELLLRFRSLASPEAFRLAGHLTVGRPELPVMRLVQAAIEQNPQPQHLAEVILSGVLTAIPGPPGSYAFRPGVRELLLRTLPRTARGRTSELLGRVGALIDARAGVAAGDFRVLAPGGGGEAAGGEPFAAVREKSVLRMGGSADGVSSSLFAGRYRLIGQRGPSRWMWHAMDVRLNRPVVVHRYPPQAAPQGRFLDQARQLAALRHPHVVPILDFGVEGNTPYLIAEFVDGVTVTELEVGSGPGVSFRVFARLVRDVTAGLEALHTRRLVRGQEGREGLLVRPDGAVMISRFALGEQVKFQDASTDVRAFGKLLQDLASVAPADGRFEQFLRQFPAYRFISRHPPRELASSPAFEPTATEADFLNFTMLGPPRVHRGERLLDIPFPKAQALLCMLLLKHGRRVTLAELAQGLWEEPPSEGDAARIRPLAIALREALGPGTLADLSDGYALHTAGDHIDVLHCEDLLNRRTQEQDPRTQRALTQEALDLWYGDPLDGVPGPAAKATRARLRALRLTLCAQRAELDLELGDFARAEADLDALLDEHPEHEDFRRLHILALRGQGRIAEAIDSYESYAERRQRQHGEPVDAVLRELYQELLTADRTGATVLVEFTERRERAWANDALGHALPGMLSSAGQYEGQYELSSLDDGFLVTAEPGTSVLPLLDAVLHELPAVLAESEPLPPKVRVTFWHAAQPALGAALERSGADTADADVTVVLSPVLHQELASGPAAVDPARFRPLYQEPDEGRLIAWYCPLELPRPAAEPDPLPESEAEPELESEQPRDLVRGPFTTRDITAVRPPAGSRTAVVHTLPDGSLTLLDAARPPGERTSGTLVTYYEVDLTTHEMTTTMTLPSSGDDPFELLIELHWHVDDPVAFVRAGISDVPGLLLEHLRVDGGRITRSLPPSWEAQVESYLKGDLPPWPAPGLSVTYRVRLSGRPSARTSVRRPTLRTLLGDAKAVLLGFDGPLVRLYGIGKSESQAMRELAALLVELRDPDEALSGARLLASDGPTPPVEGRPNPLDLLRALAGHRLSPELRRALDRIEEEAAVGARPTPHSDALIVMLHAYDREVAVVADNAPGAVRTALARRALTLEGGIHGRTEDLSLLMPNPDCLNRALTALHTFPSDAVLIASSVAELTAAHAIGLPAIGYARSPQHAGQLRRETECAVTVESLEDILNNVSYR